MTFEPFCPLTPTTYVHVLPNGWRAIYDGTFTGFKVFTDKRVYSINGIGLDVSIQKELQTWFRYVMGLGGN